MDVRNGIEFVICRRFARGGVVFVDADLSSFAGAFVCGGKFDELAVGANCFLGTRLVARGRAGRYGSAVGLFADGVGFYDDALLTVLASPGGDGRELAVNAFDHGVAGCGTSEFPMADAFHRVGEVFGFFAVRVVAFT